MDRVLIATKTTAIPEVGKALRPHLGELPYRVSYQNGIEHGRAIRHALGLPMRFTRDIDREAWRKGIENAAGNPVAALIQAPLGELLGVDHVAIGTDMDANFRPIVTSHRQYPDLAAGLLTRGVSEAEVGAVLGGNLVGLFAGVLSRSPTSRRGQKPVEWRPWAILAPWRVARCRVPRRLLPWWPLADSGLRRPPSWPSCIALPPSACV